MGMWALTDVVVVVAAAEGDMPTYLRQLILKHRYAYQPHNSHGSRYICEYISALRTGHNWRALSLCRLACLGHGRNPLIMATDVAAAAPAPAPEAAAAVSTATMAAANVNAFPNGTRPKLDSRSGLSKTHIKMDPGPCESQAQLLHNQKQNSKTIVLQLGVLD